MHDEYYSNPEPENWNGVLTWAFFENFIKELRKEIEAIQDPIEEIDKMIEELKTKYENESRGSLDWFAYASWHDALKELKSRLSTNL